MRETRIPFGKDLVPYVDAWQEVVIPRDIVAIMLAERGSASQCMNSLCILAQQETGCCPHQVLAVETWKTVLFIADQMDARGHLTRCVRYSFGARERRMIYEHDKFGAAAPGDLVLKIPSDPKGSPKRAAAKAQEGRFGHLPEGQNRVSGNGKRGSGKRAPRKTTKHGGPARYMVAVGSARGGYEGNGQQK